MAKYPAMTMTSAGANLISVAFNNGSPLIFTRIGIGSGALPDDVTIQELVDLVEPEDYVDIYSKETVGQRLKLNFIYNNQSADTAFYAKEVGLYAKTIRSDGEETQEILYAYSNAGEFGTYIPARTSALFTETMSIYVATDSSTEVIVRVSDAEYLTSENMTAHNNDYDAHPNKANSHSPVLTGIPVADTAPASTNTNQLATTKFVHDVVSSFTPDMSDYYPKDDIDAKNELLRIDINEIYENMYTKTEADDQIYEAKNGLRNEIEAEFDNYYTKTETDAALNLKVSSSALNSYQLKSEATSALNLKADAADVEEALDLKADKTDLQEIEETLDSKIDSSDLSSALDSYYTKTEVDDLIDNELEDTIRDVAEEVVSELSSETAEYASKIISDSTTIGSNSKPVYVLNGEIKPVGDTLSVNVSGSSGSAEKASADAEGNIITTTYATKNELSTYAPKSSPTITGTATVNNLQITGIHSYGTATSGKIQITSNDATDLNEVTAGYFLISISEDETGLYEIFNESYAYINTIEYNNDNQRRQVAYGYQNSSNMAIRSCYNSVWSSWSKIATTETVDTLIDTAIDSKDFAEPTSTNFNGSEKWCSGTNGAIDLSNGHCQQTSATSITMPSAPTSTDGYATTVTLFCTSTDTITWSNNIIWAGGEAPDATGNLLVTLYGANGHWYGTGMDFTQG